MAILYINTFKISPVKLYNKLYLIWIYNKMS